MAGIVSFGAYIPYYRLPHSVIGQMWGGRGGRGEKAVAGSDEDAITMYQMALSLDPSLSFARDNVEKLSELCKQKNTKNE